MADVFQALTLTMTVCGTLAKCSWSNRKAATSRMAASPTLTLGFSPGSPKDRPTKPCNETDTLRVIANSSQLESRA